MSRTASEVWRGSPASLGATWDGSGVNFALYSENAERVELCLFDPKGRREVERVDVPYRTDFVWHCYLPEARPGLLYGYRVHGPYAPEHGHRFNPHKLLLDPYARMIEEPAALDRRAFRIPRRQPPRRPFVRHARQRDRRAQEPCRRSRVHAGATTRRRASRSKDTVDLRSARQGIDQAPSRRAAAIARHVRRAREHARPRVSAAPRRHRRRAPARAHVRRRQAPGRARPAQLLGLQHDRLLRAGHALLRDGDARRIQDDGQAPAPRRPRSHPRRRLQPHGGGQPPRSHAFFPRHRQRGVLPPRRGPSSLPRLHGNRQHAIHAASHRAAPDLRQPALLGERDARRRLPLRSRERRSRASSMHSITTARSSTSHARTRCCRR